MKAVKKTNTTKTEKYPEYYIPFEPKETVVLYFVIRENDQIYYISKINKKLALIYWNEQDVRRMARKVDVCELAFLV